MFIYPDIDPIAVQLGPFAIRWYALAYLGGVVLGWWLVGKLNKRLHPPTLSPAAYDDLMVWAILGIILGGRLGYVCFYKPAYYFSHPLEILMVWQGGMSFHGGLLGVLIAMFLFGRKFKIPFFAITDLLAVVTPIGLFFGRLANFVNGELYGRITDSSLGMIFPGGGPLPRHPSQLYEASLEGIVLFAILLVLAFRTRVLERVGVISGLFLIGYSTARAISECFREPDVFLGYFAGGITMGQILSAPMWLAGIYLVFRHVPRRSTT